MHFARARWVFALILGLFVSAFAVLAAADDAKALKPGDKVTFERAGQKETGEFIEYTKPGWLRLKVINKQGKEITISVPPEKVDGQGGAKVRVERPRPDRSATDKPATPQNPDGAPAERPGRPMVGPGGRPGFGPGMRPGFGPLGRGALPPGGAPTVGAAKPTSEPFNGDAIPKAGDELAGDRLALQGAWEPLVAQVDGKIMPNADLYKFKVNFSPLEITWTLSEFRFSVDASSSPKRIKIWDAKNPIKNGRKGIYELDEGALKICLNSSIDDPWPQQFDNVEGSRFIYLICKRAGAAPAVASASSSPPPAAALRAATPAERQAINTFVERAANLLDAEKYDEFVELAIPAALVKGATADGRQQQMGFLKEVREKMAITLRALKNIDPRMNEGGTVATFDASKVTTGIPAPSIKLELIDGRWCLGK
ncbi:MAG: TIGR03067 domain-containing protein [Planctomycetes bacterium]|nr:TIGR03067 domain-containing protein [Planctomycetota bacterium]